MLVSRPKRHGRVSRRDGVNRGPEPPSCEAPGPLRVGAGLAGAGALGGEAEALGHPGGDLAPGPEAAVGGEAGQDGGQLAPHGRVQ